MDVAFYPRLTEKTYSAASALNSYVFNVPLNVNKIELKKAIEAQYSVEVISVNMARILGKTKRTVKKRGRQTLGKRSDYKKAYVVIKKGQAIPAFAIPEEKDKKEQK